MAYHGEEHACRCHGGRNKLTLHYDEELFDKLKFDAWEKEKITHGLWGKVAAVEGHGATRRPWEAFAKMMAKANLNSHTTLAMAEIGISLYSVKSSEMYSVQFVCRGCLRATDVLWPVCDDKLARDQADRTMVQIFKPYFEHLGFKVPDTAMPPPPPPPGSVQSLFASPMPAPRTGSRNSRLLEANMAELKHIDRTSFQLNWGEGTSTTASVTSRCSKSAAPDCNAANAVVPYCPSTIDEPDKYWDCYWNHSRSQQPVDAADEFDGGAQLQWRRGGQQWQWVGDGPDDWVWSPYWLCNGYGEWEWN